MLSSACYRRRIAIVLLVIGLPACIVLASIPRRGVTFRNFDRIHLGMSEAEVESILGNQNSREFNYRSYGRPSSFQEKTWYGSECRIVLTFDTKTQRVIAAMSCHRMARGRVLGRYEAAVRENPQRNLLALPMIF